MNRLGAPRYWMLDADRNLVGTDDIHEWGRWFETADRHIGDDRIGPYRVSTVFLGIPHVSFSDPGEDFLFETMVFGDDTLVRHLSSLSREDTGSIICAFINAVGGDSHDFQVRYRTMEEAQKGHAVAVDLCKQAVASLN